MTIKWFFIGSIVFAIICIAIVFIDFLKGRDWKSCAMFMFLGWIIAVAQLAGSVDS